MGADPVADPRETGKVRRKLRVVPAPPRIPLPEFHAAPGPPEPPLTADQMREARRLMREQKLRVRNERMFGERLVATLTEGQNALNIAFGAILSAYIGNMLTAIDAKPFDSWTLAAFFVLIGLFIGGLCVGNTILLRRFYKLGASFVVVGASAGWATLYTATSLGFELPILRILFICWIAMLMATDAVLTLVIFMHHQQLV